MGWLSKALSGTLGQKIIMAVTGLFLVLFLIEHLVSNLMLLKDDGTDFNAFAAFMGSNPVIRAMEIVLFLGFIIHIVYSIRITIRNKNARPQAYHYNQPAQNSTWFSRNMGISGSIVFIFLVVHLNTFFIPHKITHTETATFYDSAVAAFSTEWYVALYVLAMILLGFHLNHGFQSAFQTLGVRHPKYTPFLKGFGTGFAIIVSLGFAIIPVYMYLHHTLKINIF